MILWGRPVFSSGRPTAGMMMMMMNIETCIKNSPPDFRGHITGDKICAGFNNGSKGVCKGDSGGGLAFPEHNDTGSPRFYLRGIVSSAPTSSQLCNLNFYTTFTQVLRHENFIRQFWKTGEPCQLDPHPSVEYRCLSFENVDYYRICNEYEIAATVVSPQCQVGYHSATALPLMRCVNGNWTYVAKCIQDSACSKEVSLSMYSRKSAFYSIDNVTLAHATVQRDSAGSLTHFELHVAVQADGGVVIRLLDKVDNPDIPYMIYIGWYSNQYTGVNYKKIGSRDIHTPNVLSSTQFRPFYIKIEDEKLQIGRRGESPLVSHGDASIRSVNYFTFKYIGSNEAIIRYDCPVGRPDQS